MITATFENQNLWFSETVKNKKTSFFLNQNKNNKNTDYENFTNNNSVTDIIDFMIAMLTIRIRFINKNKTKNANFFNDEQSNKARALINIRISIPF
jgi:hypothetical protein